MPPAAGIPFGRFVLTKRLARGGMAEVFLAHQRGPEGFNRRVAVKRVLPHLVDSEEFVRMFHDEARLAARLSHPNIAHIYEFGRVDEHYFIAMEYLEGVHAGTLIKHCADEPMPPTLVARIGADACAGLRYAHQQRDDDGRELRIVHRDVSPPNLMITYDGVVKLVDFGIAKAVSHVEQTRPGVVKGKYAYMSPEQTTGQSLDGKSDVFSLGLVLWELLAGRVAFGRDDQVEVMRAIRDGKIPNLASVRSDVPVGLSTAIECALERKQKNRPDASELGLMLEGFIKSSTELGTSHHLADWVQQRFPRPRAGSQPPELGAPSAGATQASTPASQATVVSVVAPLATEVGTNAGLKAEQKAARTSGAATDTAATTKITKADLADLLDEAGDGRDSAAGDDDSIDGPSEDELTAIMRAPFRRARASAAHEKPAPAAPARSARILLAAAVTAMLGGAAYFLLTRDASTEPMPIDARPASVLVTEIVTRVDARPPPDAAPSADATPKLAVLEVLTDPAGALVTAGSRASITSPAAFADMKPGAIALRIEFGGYETIERTVHLTPGQERTLDYTLTLVPPPVVPETPPKDKTKTKTKTKTKAKKGRLTVRTRPYSVVYHGRRKLGTTPFANVSLPAGSYVLTFKHPRRKRYRKRVTIRAGKRTKLDFRLPRR